MRENWGSERLGNSLVGHEDGTPRPTTLHHWADPGIKWAEAEPVSLNLLVTLPLTLTTPRPAKQSLGRRSGALKLADTASWVVLISSERVRTTQKLHRLVGTPGWAQLPVWDAGAQVGCLLFPNPAGNPTPDLWEVGLERDGKLYPLSVVLFHLP